MPRDTALEARTIDGRYEVESGLGHGAMGAVFRCRHRFTGANVAVKLLHPQVAADGYDAQRFLAEARAPGAIGHPGITAVLDAGRTPEGELYLVMELLEGESLRAAGKRGLATGAIHRLAVEMLEAIGAAHAAGFVHRDLKPENLFVTRDGRLKLLDFGIAKVLRPTTARASTAFGAILGTPAYMAPEQFMDTSAVDARADLWSIGVVLYELLTGAAPFTGPTVPAIAGAVATVVPPPPSSMRAGLPPAIDAFFTRTLDKVAGRRFQSADEMLAAWRTLGLGGVGTGADAHAPTVQATGAAAATAAATVRDGLALRRPRPIVWIAIAVAAAVAMIVIAVAATSGGGEKRPATTADATTGTAAAAAAATGTAAAAAAAAAAAPAPAPAPDAAVAVDRPPPPVDRPPPPVDRPPPPVDRPPPPTVDAAVPERSVADICAVGCATLQRCGLADNTCEAHCARDKIAIGCMRDFSDCTGMAVCALGRTCGNKGPRGTMTCGEAAACEGACAGDFRCGCSCVSRTRRASAQALFLLNLCALSCNGDLTCVQARCGGPLTRCARE